MSEFEEALIILSDAGVRFVVVGGVAATLHGLNYVTFDLGFCYARDNENLSRIINALFPLNPRLREAPVGLPFRFDEIR